MKFNLRLFQYPNYGNEQGNLNASTSTSSASDSSSSSAYSGDGQDPLTYEPTTTPSPLVAAEESTGHEPSESSSTPTDSTYEPSEPPSSPPEVISEDRPEAAVEDAAGACIDRLGYILKKHFPELKADIGVLPQPSLRVCFDGRLCHCEPDLDARLKIEFEGEQQFVQLFGECKRLNHNMTEDNILGQEVATLLAAIEVKRRNRRIQTRGEDRKRRKRDKKLKVSSS